VGVSSISELQRGKCEVEYAKPLNGHSGAAERFNKSALKCPLAAHRLQKHRYVDALFDSTTNKRRNAMVSNKNSILSSVCKLEIISNAYRQSYGMPNYDIMRFGDNFQPYLLKLHTVISSFSHHRRRIQNKIGNTR